MVRTPAPRRPPPLGNEASSILAQHIPPLLIRLSPECLDFSIELLKLDEPPSLSRIQARRDNRVTNP
jgi:hypothetical protein